MSHHELPFFFCVTMLITQFLDLYSTEIGLRMGFIETCPYYSVPTTIYKIVQPLLYWLLYLITERVAEKQDFKTFRIIYAIGYLYHIGYYSVTLISNFNLILNGM